MFGLKKGVERCELGFFDLIVATDWLDLLDLGSVINDRYL